MFKQFLKCVSRRQGMQCIRCEWQNGWQHLHWQPVQEEAVNCPVPVPAGSETRANTPLLAKTSASRGVCNAPAQTCWRKSGNHEWQETSGEASGETCQVDSLEDALGDTREIFQHYMRYSQVIWGRTQKFQEETEVAIQRTSSSTAGLHKSSIAGASVLTHFRLLPHCTVSLVGHGGHLIYKTAHISVIKVFLYLSSFSLHTVSVVLHHDSACLNKR